MAPLTKVQIAKNEILDRFDALPIDEQKGLVTGLRDRFLANAVRSSAASLFAPVDVNSVLEAVTGDAPQMATAPSLPYTGKKRGPKPGWKQNRQIASNAEADEPEDKTQHLIEQICNAHPEGINVLGIRDELTSMPEFHTNSEGDNLTALIRNCLTRAKKNKQIRHFARGLYGPKQRGVGRPRLTEVGVGVN